MIFCSENAADIQRYFRNTFMKFPTFSGDQLYFVDHVNDYSVTGKYFEKGEVFPFDFKLHPTTVKSPITVEFILPQKSFFMFEGKLFFLYRVPARQYHRGIHRENTCVINVDDDEAVPLSFELLDAYVQKQTVGNINDNVAVLHRRIARHNDRILLDRKVIATIPFQGCIKMKEKVFQPEIERIIKSTTGWKIEQEAAKPSSKVKRVTKKYGVDEHGELVAFEEI